MATIAVTIPIGTLTRKIQRQLSSTRRPPIGGPSAAATPPTADQMPIARVALLGREGGEDEAERGRQHHRPAGRLQDAGGDEDVERGGERAEGRGGGEEQQAEEEDALAADPVGDAPGRHEQRGEDDRVGVQHPGEARAGRRRRSPAAGRGRRC